MKSLIKNILKEEVEDKKIKLVIDFVRNTYKDSNLIIIRDTSVGEYYDRPMVRFYYRAVEDLDGTENFVTKRACDSFNKFWGGSVTIAPFWFPTTDKTFINADVLIDFWEMG
jgi:hypothetical protein